MEGLGNEARIRPFRAVIVSTEGLKYSLYMETSTYSRISY